MPKCKVIIRSESEICYECQIWFDLYSNYVLQEEILVAKPNANNENELLLMSEEELWYFGNVAHVLKPPLVTLMKRMSDGTQAVKSIIVLRSV